MMDAARLLFATTNSDVEIFEGSQTVADFLDMDLFSDDYRQCNNEQGQISEGSRNSTMSVIAGKLIKRYGNTDVAQDEFLKMAETCNPPLPEIELRTIWNSAVNSGRRSQIKRATFHQKSTTLNAC